MKKLGSMIITIGLILCSLMSGCSYYYNIDKKFISDGDFKYYYLEGKDCYTIVGLNEIADKENLYVPTHYKNKEINYIGYTKTSFTGFYTNYTINAVDIKNIYLPYTVGDLYGRNDGFYKGYPERAFFVGSEDHLAVAYTLQFSQEKTVGYVTEKIFKYLEKDFNEERNQKEYIGDYISSFYFSTNSKITMRIANTSYMFNYEGAVNEGYFFINDFERGEKIEDTPYEPTREGYTFGGWYKEPECKNAWDFGADTLPDAEYDEEGVLIFRETQLYAKWIKN